MPPAGRWPGSRARRSSITRRSLLARALLMGASAPTLSALLASCGNQLYTSGNLVIASPSKPVRWPVSEKNPPIESGLEPKAGGTLRIYSYDEYISPQVIKNFEKTYDVDVSYSTFNDSDEALAKIASGHLSYDVYNPSYDQIGKMVGARLLRPLNHDYIPNIDNLWPQFKNPWYDLGWQYSVPYTVYTTGIGWRVDQVSEDIAQRENPYDVFWDPQYSGKLEILDDWHSAMCMVLLRNGIYDANTANVADLKLLRTQLIELLSVTHPKVNITMYNDLPVGQVALAQMWSGDVVNAIYYLPKGVSPDILRYWFPADGRGMVDNDLIVCLSGGDNPVAAHFFINYMLDPKVAALNFSFIGYQPPQRSINPQSLVAEGFVPQNLATTAVLPRYFTHGVHLLELPPTVDGQWHEIWQEFKAGG
jgi:spermidine/putrescine transport system substrate-binding protein